MHAWNPRLLGDIESLEKEQRRASEISTKLSKLSYYRRLAELGLTSLENRRVRGDLIQMFKIMRGDWRLQNWKKTLTSKKEQEDII